MQKLAFIANTAVSVFGKLPTHRWLLAVTPPSTSPGHTPRRSTSKPAGTTSSSVAMHRWWSSRALIRWSSRSGWSEHSRARRWSLVVVVTHILGSHHVSVLIVHLWSSHHSRWAHRANSSRVHSLRVIRGHGLHGRSYCGIRHHDLSVSGSPSTTAAATAGAGRHRQATRQIWNNGRYRVHWWDHACYRRLSDSCCQQSRLMMLVRMLIGSE